MDSGVPPNHPISPGFSIQNISKPSMIGPHWWQPSFLSSVSHRFSPCVRPEAAAPRIAAGLQPLRMLGVGRGSHAALQSGRGDWANSWGWRWGLGKSQTAWRGFSRIYGLSIELYTYIYNISYMTCFFSVYKLLISNFICIEKPFREHGSEGTCFKLSWLYLFLPFHSRSLSWNATVHGWFAVVDSFWVLEFYRDVWSVV